MTGTWQFIAVSPNSTLTECIPFNSIQYVENAFSYFTPNTFLNKNNSGFFENCTIGFYHDNTLAAQSTVNLSWNSFVQELYKSPSQSYDLWESNYENYLFDVTPYITTHTAPVPWVAWVQYSDLPKEITTNKTKTDSKSAKWVLNSFMNFTDNGWYCIGVNSNHTLASFFHNDISDVNSILDYTTTWLYIDAYKANSQSLQLQDPSSNLFPQHWDKVYLNSVSNGNQAVWTYIRRKPYVFSYFHGNSILPPLSHNNSLHSLFLYHNSSGLYVPNSQLKIQDNSYNLNCFTFDLDSIHYFHIKQGHLFVMSNGNSLNSFSSSSHQFTLNSFHIDDYADVYSLNYGNSLNIEVNSSNSYFFDLNNYHTQSNPFFFSSTPTLRLFNSLFLLDRKVFNPNQVYNTGFGVYSFSSLQGFDFKISPPPPTSNVTLHGLHFNSNSNTFSNSFDLNVKYINSAFNSFQLIFHSNGFSNSILFHLNSNKTNGDASLYLSKYIQIRNSLFNIFDKTHYNPQPQRQISSINSGTFCILNDTTSFQFQLQSPGGPSSVASFNSSYDGEFFVHANQLYIDDLIFISDHYNSHLNSQVYNNFLYNFTDNCINNVSVNSIRILPSAFNQFYLQYENSFLNSSALWNDTYPATLFHFPSPDENSHFHLHYYNSNGESNSVLNDNSYFDFLSLPVSTSFPIPEGSFGLISNDHNGFKITKNSKFPSIVDGKLRIRYNNYFNFGTYSDNSNSIYYVKESQTSNSIIINNLTNTNSESIIKPATANFQRGQYDASGFKLTAINNSKEFSLGYPDGVNENTGPKSKIENNTSSDLGGFGASGKELNYYPIANGAFVVHGLNYSNTHRIFIEDKYDLFMYQHNTRITKFKLSMKYMTNNHFPIYFVDKSRVFKMPLILYNSNNLSFSDISGKTPSPLDKFNAGNWNSMTIEYNSNSANIYIDGTDTTNVNGVLDPESASYKGNSSNYHWTLDNSVKEYFDEKGIDIQNFNTIFFGSLPLTSIFGANRFGVPYGNLEWNNDINFAEIKLEVNDEVMTYNYHPLEDINSNSNYFDINGTAVFNSNSNNGHFIFNCENMGFFAENCYVADLENILTVNYFKDANNYNRWPRTLATYKRLNAINNASIIINNEDFTDLPDSSGAVHWDCSKGFEDTRYGYKYIPTQAVEVNSHGWQLNSGYVELFNPRNVLFQNILSGNPGVYGYVNFNFMKTICLTIKVPEDSDHLFNNILSWKFLTNLENYDKTHSSYLNTSRSRNGVYSNFIYYQYSRDRQFDYIQGRYGGDATTTDQFDISSEGQRTVAVTYMVYETTTKADITFVFSSTSGTTIGHMGNNHTFNGSGIRIPTSATGILTSDYYNNTTYNYYDTGEDKDRTSGFTFFIGNTESDKIKYNQGITVHDVIIRSMNDTNFIYDNTTNTTNIDRIKNFHSALIEKAKTQMTD